MGAYGEHSSRLRNFEGFKLVTNLKETKEAKCKYLLEAPRRGDSNKYTKHMFLKNNMGISVKKYTIR